MKIGSFHNFSFLFCCSVCAVKDEASEAVAMSLPALQQSSRGLRRGCCSGLVAAYRAERRACSVFFSLLLPPRRFPTAHVPSTTSPVTSRSVSWDAPWMLAEVPRQGCFPSGCLVWAPPPSWEASSPTRAHTRSKSGS